MLTFLPDSRNEVLSRLHLTLTGTTTGLGRRQAGGWRSPEPHTDVVTNQVCGVFSQWGLSSQPGAREPCPKAVSRVKYWGRGLLRQG